jgi:hypothetical protein
MRMTQHNRVDLGYVERELPILRVGFSAFTLKHSEIKQNSVLPYFDEMLATSHFPGSTKASETHKNNSIELR